jgi:tRNA pseudouridine38-40 synthase
MPRYRITVEYDGAPFVGWQFQINGPSVAGAIANAIAQLTGKETAVHGAGRTDAGVHHN